MSEQAVVGKIEQLTNTHSVGLSDVERFVMQNTNEPLLQRLIQAAEKWDTEDSKYLCLSWSNAIYLSNNLDCNGDRQWSRKGFEKFIAKLLV